MIPYSSPHSFSLAYERPQPGTILIATYVTMAHSITVQALDQEFG